MTIGGGRNPAAAPAAAFPLLARDISCGWSIVKQRDVSAGKTGE